MADAIPSAPIPSSPIFAQPFPRSAEAAAWGDSYGQLTALLARSVDVAARLASNAIADFKNPQVRCQQIASDSIRAAESAAEPLLKRIEKALSDARSEAKGDSPITWSELLVGLNSAGTVLQLQGTKFVPVVQAEQPTQDTFSAASRIDLANRVQYLRESLSRIAPGALALELSRRARDARVDVIFAAQGLGPWELDAANVDLSAVRTELRRVLAPDAFAAQETAERGRSMVLAALETFKSAIAAATAANVHGDPVAAAAGKAGA